MSEHTDIERVLVVWFDEGPTTMPDRVATVVADRIGRQRQRGRWRDAWMSFAMNPTLKVGLAAVAVLLVAVVGWNLFSNGSAPVGGTASSPTSSPAPVTTAAPTATPTVVSTPSPTASPSPTLAPPPQVSLEGSLPDGWSVTSGATYAGTVNIAMAFQTGATGKQTVIELVPNRSVSAADCALDAEPGVGTSAQAIVDALAARRGIIASDQGPAAVGGLTGRQIDLRVDPAIGTTCPDDSGGFIPTIGYRAGADWLYNGIGSKDVARYIVLDASGGRNIVVAIYAADAATFDRDIRDAMTIVEGLRFDLGA